MVPTKERNVSGVFLSYGAEGILFDCGEGTQRQMNIAGINRNRVTRILITHWHADHVAGLPGLLHTIDNKEAEKRIDILGPKRTMERMQYLQKTFVHDSHLNLRIQELDAPQPVRCLETEDYYLECANLHHTTACIGFSFVEKDKRKINVQYLKEQGVKEGPHLQKLQKGESILYKNKIIDVDKATTIVKGRKVTFIVDTKFCENAIRLARNADVLICEASYADKLQEKAELYKHLTAGQAAQIASQAGARQLIVTHFSQRYKNTLDIQADARTVFDNVICAEDFMKVKVEREK